MPIHSRTSQRLVASKLAKRPQNAVPRIKDADLPYLRLLGAVFKKPVLELTSQVPAAASVSSSPPSGPLGQAQADSAR